MEGVKCAKCGTEWDKTDLSGAFCPWCDEDIPEARVWFPYAKRRDD